MPSNVTISQGTLSAVISTMGAELKSLALDGREYLWQGNPKWWGKSAPVLFPLVGATGYDVLQTAAGPAPVPKHGFARDVEFHLVEQSEDGASVAFELSESEYTLARYPYPFSLRMTYAITGPATLKQTFRVENAGDVPMPFSVGGHPAFNVPVSGVEGETFEDYELRFTEAWTADSPKISVDGIMSYADPFHVLQNADALSVSRDLFVFDTVVFRDVPGARIELVGKKSGHGVRVDFPDFDFVGIWSAAPDAPFVAVEPWTGHAALDVEDDVFEHRDNITILAPGEVDERSFEITLL
ncbi:aldose 1-epimerase family protein [Collinsella provencensis]|uniref:aldose 1-epimerase family protein n=1 Tax=Collinsella provencensis TaxID=1937461 RepID=UPI000C85BCAA|nr:aldose 1-epimerase family protein [Collinsella provencensis]